MALREVEHLIHWGPVKLIGRPGKLVDETPRTLKVSSQGFGEDEVGVDVEVRGRDEVKVIEFEGDYLKSSRTVYGDQINLDPMTRKVVRWSP